MSKQTIRPYEMSLWGLQDDYIITLASPNISHKGQIFEPELNIKDDGTETLRFSIPMYLYDNNIKKENPLWFNVINGTLMVGQRKIKVKFLNTNKIYEFVISKISESHANGELLCLVEAEGLAFNELGKTGYKISLNQQTFEDDYDNWFNNFKDTEPEPIASINYWADKIFNGTNWNYEVRMDWSSYDGVVGDGERKSNKIYEDSFVSSWEENNGNLIGSGVEYFKEKARMIEIDKSNRYNASQTLAETFRVFCRYEYTYDENDHITKRTCIFYNSFLDESGEKEDIIYPYNTSEITRELDTTEITTKMYVVPLEDSSTQSGLLTISDVSANKMREDYIFNFDYLYSIGGINNLQKKELKSYEIAIFSKNKALEKLSTDIFNLESINNDLRAKISFYSASQDEAVEQMNKAKDMIDALIGDDGTLSKTAGKPDSAVYLLDEDNTYRITISQEGVKENTLHLYNTYSGGILSDEVILIEENKVFDEITGFIVGLRKLAGKENSSRCYLTYDYSPKLYYQAIYNSFARRLTADQINQDKAESELLKNEELLNSKKEEHAKILEEKNKIVLDFENMMGPAIKEGSWQAEDYKDFGNKYQEEISENNSTEHLTFIWDKELFDNEQKEYYTEGINEDKIYYNAILFNDCYESIKNHLDDLCLFSADNKKILKIGSQLYYGFYERSNIIPVILILDKTFDITDCNLGYIETSIDTNGNEKTENKILCKPTFFSRQSTDLFVYPRIKILSPLVKTNYNDISIKNNENVLEKYYDYSILNREGLYYITIDNNFYIKTNNKSFDISFNLSNGALCMYLDAIDVLKINSAPKVSYTVSITFFNKDKKIGTLVNIIDHDLKFENVQGYISELNLLLDAPWNDTITIKNYKTKFEDLFTKIAVSSEQMKTNGYLYNNAASAFNSNGVLKEENIQETLNQANLTYSFMNGDLIIDEENGIWGISDAGVVAYRGGGIFCATEKDSYGNWKWNTGITPTGINASLLRAGQLDTNLIRIFAGDNISFQMNGDGLFAYRFTPNGETTPFEYVVHNGEGLFLTNWLNKIIDGTNQKVLNDQTYSQVDRVEISWNGLILRNDKNEDVFFADNEGNLTLKGHIEANSGNIGGWNIYENYLVSGDTGMASGPDETIQNVVEDKYVAFWAGANLGNEERGFRVLSDGSLKASGVTIEGTINATGGTIGNLTIQEVTDSIQGIELISENGDVYSYRSESNIPENSELKFSISLTAIEPISYELVKSYDGEIWESSGITILTSQNSFTVPYTIMNFTIDSQTVLKNIVYLKIIANTSNGAYEDIVTLYNMYDGKKGADGDEGEFYSIEFEYDNYYKFVKNLVKETSEDNETIEKISYDYSPVSVRAAIVKQLGTGDRTYIQSNEEKRLTFEVFSENTWYEVTNSLDNYWSKIILNEITVEGNLLDKIERVKVNLESFKNNTWELMYSEIKFLEWGTSEDAAKFDFIASGAYITTNGISYTFNSDGFKISKATRQENESGEETIIYDDIFYVDQDGDLVTKGKIEADSGYIAGWAIEYDKILKNYIANEKELSIGLFSGDQSIYYNDINDVDSYANELGFYSTDYSTFDEYYEEVQQHSLGTAPAFFAGEKIENRIVYGFTKTNEEKLFKNSNTYTLTLLQNGMIYAKDTVIDGTLFLNKRVSLSNIDENNNIIKDYHIFSVEKNENYNINYQNDIYNIFFGVSKINNENKYRFAIASNGDLFAANGRFFIGDNKGLFIKSSINNIDYTLYSGISPVYDSIINKPVFWIGRKALNNNEENLNLLETSLENTAFYISDNDITYIKNAILENAQVNNINISSLTLGPSKEGQNLLYIRPTLENGYSYNGAIERDGTLNFDNIISKKINLGNIYLSLDGIFSNNFYINNNTATARIPNIEAANIKTAIFTKEKINSINGSIAIINNARIKEVIEVNDASFKIVLENDGTTLSDAILSKGFLVACENVYGESNRTIVTNIELSNNKIIYTVEKLVSNSSIYNVDDILFIYGVPELKCEITNLSFSTWYAWISVKINKNYWDIFDEIRSFFLSTLKINNYYVNSIALYSEDDNYYHYRFRISPYKKFTISSTQPLSPEINEIWYNNLTRECLIWNGSIWIPTPKYIIDEHSFKIGEKILINIDKIPSYSKIFLRTTENYPEISLYRSAFISEDTPLNENFIVDEPNSMVLRIGNLSNIYDKNFGGLLKGTGIYAENAYLKGSLYLPGAGITDNSEVFFNREEWEKISVTPSDSSPIRLWAGATTENRKKAPFIVTEDGSLYATKGVFKGEIYASNGVFSGTIESAGVLLDKDSSKSNFFFAQKNSSGVYTPKDYYINVTAGNGLEIYDSGFGVFSGIERSTSQNLYLDYDSNETTNYNYQFPYVSVEDNSQTLLAYRFNLAQLQFATESSTIKYRYSGVYQDNYSFYWYNESNYTNAPISNDIRAWKGIYQGINNITNVQSKTFLKMEATTSGLILSERGAGGSIIQINPKDKFIKINTNCRIEEVEGGFNIKYVGA